MVMVMVVVMAMVVAMVVVEIVTWASAGFRFIAPQKRHFFDVSDAKLCDHERHQLLR